MKVSPENNEEWFWQIVKQTEKNRSKLLAILSGMEKEQIINFQEHFVDASLELQDQPYSDLVEGAEDSLEDVAHWVVSQGKEFYEQVIDNPSLMPIRVEESDPEILYGVAGEHYRERFGGNIGVYG